MLRAVHELLVFAAACVAGAINSVAGGGTLITVPTLIWLGMPAINANATSTVALWPGSLSGAWGFRRELLVADRRVFALIVPSLIGGLAGAILLHQTPPDVFERLIPVLILFAIGLTPREKRDNPETFLRLPALLLALLVAFTLGYVAIDTEWAIADREGFEETASIIGEALLDKYVLPFEVASVLLLAAMLGAIVLVRPESAVEPLDLAQDEEGK